MACRRVLSKCPLLFSFLKTTRRAMERVNYLELHEAISRCGSSISSSQWTTADNIFISTTLLDSRHCEPSRKTRHFPPLRLHGNHPILSNSLIYSMTSPLPTAKGKHVRLQQPLPTSAAKAAVIDDMEGPPAFQQPLTFSPTLLPWQSAPLAAGQPLGSGMCLYHPPLWQPMSGHSAGSFSELIEFFYKATFDELHIYHVLLNLL